MMISNRLYATTLNGRAMDGILLRGGEERRDVIVAGPVGGVEGIWGKLVICSHLLWGYVKRGY
jgi:hypothetical protein